MKQNYIQTNCNGHEIELSNFYYKGIGENFTSFEVFLFNINIKNWRK